MVPLDGEPNLSVTNVDVTMTASIYIFSQGVQNDVLD